MHGISGQKSFDVLGKGAGGCVTLVGALLQRSVDDAVKISLQGSPQGSIAIELR
jgi:hypothetical protein